MTDAKTLRLSDFAGSWDVTRTISDHAGGPDGTFLGTADFTPDGNHLIYHETGLLQMAGHAPFKAERRYLWRADGTTFVVDFHDGRAFHSFDPRAAEAVHWCDPDTYAVTYAFDDWPVWQSTWSVTGPRKAYEMVTTYRRPAL